MPLHELSGYASGNHADSGGAPALTRNPVRISQRAGSYPMPSKAIDPVAAISPAIPAMSNDAAKKVDGRIAHPGALRRVASTPYDHRRCDGHQLPENEQGEEITGQDDADRRPRIAQGRGKFDDAALIKTEKSTRESHEGEDGREQARQRVGLKQRKLIAEKVSASAIPSGSCHTRTSVTSGDPSRTAYRTPAQERQRQPCEDQHERAARNRLLIIVAFRTPEHGPERLSE